MDNSWSAWLTKEIAKVIIAFVVFPILIFFRKLPGKLLEEYRARKSMESANRGKQIMYILSDLSNETEAIYVHVIKYLYNGGPQKMSIEYEEPGHVCLGCTIDCPNRNGVVRLQDNWLEVHVRKDWAVVVEETIRRRGKVNTADKEKLSDLSTQLWKDANIEIYKEAVIKHHSKGFYALGLSFCSESKTHDEMGAKIWVASRKLEKYL